VAAATTSTGSAEIGTGTARFRVIADGIPEAIGGAKGDAERGRALMLGRERPRTIPDILLYIGAPVGVGLANLAFYYQQVLPALGGSTVPTYAGFWGNYGPTPARALLAMARQPWRLLGATFSPGVARVLAPHLFLPVIAWR
jgi:hypothetical protein